MSTKRDVPLVVLKGRRRKTKRVRYHLSVKPKLKKVRFLLVPALKIYLDRDEVTFEEVEISFQS